MGSPLLTLPMRCHALAERVWGGGRGAGGAGRKGRRPGRTDLPYSNNCLRPDTDHLKSQRKQGRDVFPSSSYTLSLGSTLLLACIFLFLYLNEIRLNNFFSLVI